jgi:hypothetical protein
LVSHLFLVMSRNQSTPEELALLKEDDNGSMDVDGSTPNANTNKQVVPLDKDSRDRSGSTSTSKSGSEEQTMPRAYYNVIAARAASTAVRSLGGSSAINLNPVGTFVTPTVSAKKLAQTKNLRHFSIRLVRHEGETF